MQDFNILSSSSSSSGRKRSSNQRDNPNDAKQQAMGDRTVIETRRVEHAEIRFDFMKPTDDDEDREATDEDVSSVLTKLATFKQQLNEVKSLLSDKDIVDWNRHTAYMNTASTIVPYLRKKLNIEVGTQAWAKMFEILANFDLIHCANEDQFWTTLHLCEAPGAFISALNHFLVTRKSENTTHTIDWQWYAQTLNPYYEHDPSTATMLIDDDRLIFHTVDQNRWDFGMDNSGNLMCQTNIQHYISRFKPMNIHLITADGSFDVQNDPAEQELLVYPLLKTEVSVALSCLAKHGNLILKIFTIFEKVTIDLINLLYRTFRQISMFKPRTSKKGNSEVYIVCMDFDGQLETISSYSFSFLEQIVRCSHLFQSIQIDIIEHNLKYFQNLNRTFIKKLQKTKDQMLDTFLDRCQVRELLPNDRHLLRTDLEYVRFHRQSHTISRTGTFNDRHRPADDLRDRIRSGVYCSTCSSKNENTLCEICQTLCHIIDNPSSSNNHILVGTITTPSPTIVDCVFGVPSTNIRSSCFCDRYLLELCSNMSINLVLPDQESTYFDTIVRAIHDRSTNSVSFEQLRTFCIQYHIDAFEQTFLHVIPSNPPHLLFLFRIVRESIDDECQRIESLIRQATGNADSKQTLLQFVAIHQLLSTDFASNLIQANNLCLQLKCVT